MIRKQFDDIIYILKGNSYSISVKTITNDCDGHSVIFWCYPNGEWNNNSEYITFKAKRLDGKEFIFKNALISICSDYGVSYKLLSNGYPEEQEG